MNNNEYFSINDTIEDNVPIILEEGDYTFQVVGMDLNERFRGSQKIQPCDMVVAHLLVHAKEGRVLLKEQFIFYKPLAWKIFAFFRCLGLIRPDKPASTMPWTCAQGCWGKAHIVKRSYYTNQNEERFINNVDKWIMADAKVIQTNQKAIELAEKALANPQPIQTQPDNDDDLPF